MDDITKFGLSNSKSIVFVLLNYPKVQKSGPLEVTTDPRTRDKFLKRHFILIIIYLVI